MTELLVSPRRLTDADSSARAERWSMNRPSSRNALSPALVGAMRQALVAAERAGIQVVVLEGEGRSFCAGADLAYLSGFDDAAGPTPRAFFADIWELTLAMENSSIVFVASIHGHAVAGGLELALACDVVVAADDALIGDGHVRNNLMPGGGASARMERAVGIGTARWLALTGALVRADDPGFAGWITRTAPAGDLNRVTDEVIEALLGVPAVAQSRYKTLLRQVAGRPTASDMQRELDMADAHWFDQDVPAALRLFLAKNRKAS